MLQVLKAHKIKAIRTKNKDLNILQVQKWNRYCVYNHYLRGTLHFFIAALG